jgi:hypothetical protein
VLGLESGKAFSPKVQYIYRKQLEEADIIAVNKRDLVESGCLDRLEQALRECCPSAVVVRMSARLGSGLDRWIAALSANPGIQAPPEVDYDVYADGEALLGWLNGSAAVTAPEPFDCNLWLLELARRIRGSLSAGRFEIAHLKVTLAPGDGAPHPAVLNLVSSQAEPVLSHTLERKLSGGELLINARAEAPPEVLRAAVESALAASREDGAIVLVRSIQCFSPARPTPTHRLTLAQP